MALKLSSKRIKKTQDMLQSWIDAGANGDAI